jgi:hypothetical protein
MIQDAGVISSLNATTIQRRLDFMRWIPWWDWGVENYGAIATSRRIGHGKNPRSFPEYIPTRGLSRGRHRRSTSPREAGRVV